MLVSDFAQWLFSNAGRSINVLRKRSENFWNFGKASIVEIAPRLDDLVDKIAYVVTNPVTAGLVSHAKHWPGLIVLPKYIEYKVFSASRPNYHYRSSGAGCLPERAQFTATLPKCIDATAEELLNAITLRCQKQEQRVREEMRAQGRRFMGVRRILRVDVTESPTIPSPWIHTLHARKHLSALLC